MPPDPFDKHWHVHVDEKTYGPYTGHDIRRLVEQRKIVESDLVYSDDGSHWIEAQNDPILGTLFRTPDKRSFRSNYLAKVLRPGEKILAERKLHWIIYFPVIAWLALGIIAWFSTGTILAVYFGIVAPAAGAWTFALFGCIALLKAPAIWLKRRATEIAVTDRRVIYKTGLIRRHTTEMNMDKVESVLVDQSVIGRFLNYGTIHIRGTGIGIENLHYISSPISFRNTVLAK